jgi:outer membrane protein assembly factor BamE (lipoprotein component of BamABCDE complex)
MKKLLILILLFLSSCTLNKVVQHHGVHNLEKKQAKLKVNFTNKNEIIELIGPPSTKSSFDNDLYIYIERKTTSTRLSRLGKKKLLVNNVAILELDSRGLLVSKKFYDKDDMQKIKFEEQITTGEMTKNSFVYKFLYSLRQKINDPLGKKRIKN